MRLDTAKVCYPSPPVTFATEPVRTRSTRHHPLRGCLPTGVFLEDRQAKSERSDWRIDQ
jgi:hypothetical protein